MSDNDEDDSEREDYDSGPFCRHWSDPADCEIVCANCGHRCGQHEDSECSECNCEEWKESE